MQEKDPSRPVTGYSAPKAYSYCDSSFIRFLASTVVFFAGVGVGVIIIFTFSVLQPIIVQVDSLSLSNSSVAGNWNVRFSVTNPNENMFLAYDNVSSSIFYKNEFISETSLPPFNQPVHNRKVLDAAFSATNTYVEAWLVNDINGDRKRGTVSFNVKVLARLELRVGGWMAGNLLLTVCCEGVPVGVSANRTGSGNLVGGPRKCTVHLQYPDQSRYQKRYPEHLEL